MAVELGMKFRADTSGSVLGVRFHKALTNTGTHSGSLWSADGTRLASAVFQDETATGWQTVMFPTPVAIDAHTTYIASYFAPQGHYSVTYNFFTAEQDNGPLHVLESTDDDPNGVFRYGPTSGFPSGTNLSANYWVDVIFTPGPPPMKPLPLDRGLGGPVLVVTSDDLPFTKYYTEILRAEGINSFDTADLGAVTTASLAPYDVVILGETPLDDAEVAMFTDWVKAGGNLIAGRPDKKLADLLGVKDTGDTLAEGYLLISTGTAPGAGLPDQTIQYHGAADLYEAMDGTTTIATLYRDAEQDTDSPAVTLREVGSGHAVAFTYDLARSIVFTRQGNPDWVGDERDGDPPLRPVDLFYGAKVGDDEPDWVNLDKASIAQADEQQRLLGNIITLVNRGKRPIPKFWYLPNGHRCVVVMALDDHGTDTGTRDFFERLKAINPGGKVADWTAARGTSWLFLEGTTLTDAQAVKYLNQGFDLGIHVNTNGLNWTPPALEATFHAELTSFVDRYPSLPPQTGSRTHWIVWSDWASQPKIELSKGIRMDLNYYYYPDFWVKNRPGVFTGSALPMRYADLDGTMIDVYQVTTHLVNQNGQTYPAGIDILLDRALGEEGVYGAYGTHFDLSDFFDQQVMASAAARGVPMISAQQILDWTDGRNRSHFSNIAWSGDSLTFTAQVDSLTNEMLVGMLPMHSAKGALTAITRAGAQVAFTQETIKGVTYAMFGVSAGAHSVTYNPYAFPASLWPDSTVPTNLTATDASAGELGVKFTPAVPGRITAVRFYKGPQNSGTHTVSVWATDGTRLATATATSETAGGWQTVPLTTPVDVAAGATYIASYFAPGGHYSYDLDYFDNAHTAGPLTAPASLGSAGNSVFALGSSFPDRTFRNINYWVDVVFTP